MLTLRYFARLREVFGSAHEQLVLPQPADVQTLIALLRQRGEPWESALAPGMSYRVAVNQNMTGPEHRLEDGDEVAIFPPVTGG